MFVNGQFQLNFFESELIMKIIQLWRAHLHKMEDKICFLNQLVRSVLGILVSFFLLLFFANLQNKEFDQNFPNNIFSIFFYISIYLHELSSFKIMHFSYQRSFSLPQFVLQYLFFGPVLCRDKAGGHFHKRVFFRVALRLEGLRKRGPVRSLLPTICNSSQLN